MREHTLTSVRRTRLTSLEEEKKEGEERRVRPQMEPGYTEHCCEKSLFCRNPDSLPCLEPHRNVMFSK